MQRSVQRKMSKKNKGPAGFSHLDDEYYSVEYDATDHWGEYEDHIPYMSKNTNDRELIAFFLIYGKNTRIMSY